jgi:alkanesulfonate monooxygenase SsuD/methylene tetrahydromethanopterin reductase-like flavin-dependent oxidoreductase (luciferase family)
MLSRAQPRPADAPDLSLADMQNPMIDAYLAALPAGRTPRILASRTVFVADDEREAMRLAEAGLERHHARLTRLGRMTGRGSVDDLVAAFNVHLGTPDRVIESLSADSALARATEFTVQVHSIDPPHPFILRSIELVAEVVAPALGWQRDDDTGIRRVA